MKDLLSFSQSNDGQVSDLSVWANLVEIKNRSYPTNNEEKRRLLEELLSSNYPKYIKMVLLNIYRVSVTNTYDDIAKHEERLGLPLQPKVGA